MTRYLRTASAVYALALAGTAFAVPESGRVVRVIDGNTVVVRLADGRERTATIPGADAPESGQDHSAQAKRRAESHLLGRGVTIGRDGQIRRSGRDIAESLIRDGATWHDPDARQTPTQQARREAAEREAREARRGLWRADEPENPKALRERRDGRRAER